MPPKRRRRFQGLYYHSSPPKVLPMNGQASNHGRRRRDVDDFSIKLSTIRIWMHEKDIGKLTRILWAGQGSRLCQQASTNPRVKRFLSAVPYVMNSIKDVHQAVIDNTLETLQAKMEPPVPPALITCRDANGLNLIHKAAGLGHTKILEYLISIWPDGVSETDITGKTPLHWAASHKNNMRCYTLLTQAGCDEEAMDYKMKTPTYYRHKPHEIERAFLVYVPEAPRVSPDVATDWEALSEEVVDGAKKLELKVPDTNGRTTDDSIENTSEVDLNDGISATEEEHAATPTANGNGSDVVPLDDVKAETENEESTNAGDAEENGIETREDNGGVAINGNDEAEEQHENGAEVETLESAAADETNMKTLTETTTTKNGSGEQAEQTENETVAAEEKSSGANESEHGDERDTSEKEKDADVTTIKKEIEANVLSEENEEGQKGNEKLMDEANEQDTGKENSEVVESSKDEGTEEEEKAKTTELTIEETKLEDQTQDAEKESEIEETKEENKENEDEEPEQEKGIVEKIKESAQDLADSIKKAIGVETKEMDEDANKLAEKINDKMVELEESVKKDNETEEINKNGKQAQEEGENEKDDGGKENEKVETANDIKKDKKDNENENIKNQGDEKEANLEKSDSAENGNEVENEKGVNKKEESENKKEENESEEKKEDNKPDNDVVEKDDANNVQENNEETVKNESEVKLNDEKIDSSKENETEANEEVVNKENLEQEKEKKIDNETKGNANTNDNNENAQAQSEQNKEDKDMAEAKENTKEIKTEATKANDKTEENVRNTINGHLDKATEDIEKKSETMQENGELDGKEEMQKEAGEPKSAVEMRNAMGEQNHEKIPRLSTAKVTGNKRNGSSKRKSSGKKSASKLVEGVHEEDDDDDDDDDDEDDEVQFGVL